MVLIGVLVMHIELYGQPATPQDCLGAIPVCQEVYTENQSPQGGGSVLEINTQFNCMQVESNSFWYTFTVNQSGNFGFLLTPNNSLDDYDWALFDITSASCEDLFADPSLIVSCNAAGGGSCLGATGATGASVYDNQGFSCNNNPPSTSAGFSPFNDFIPVIEGNTYVLCVSNWSGSTNGYVIDFGLSTGIGIFDDTPPVIEDIQVVGDCEIAEINLLFSEFIQCNTLDVSNLPITGLTGNYNITLSSVNCDAGGNFSKSFNLTFTPPVSESGDLTLLLDVNGISEALDLCDNPALQQSFELSSSALGNVELGADISLCVGQTRVLQAGNSGYTYVWQDGSTGPEYTVAQPGIYSVTATTPCTVVVDSVSVTYTEETPTLELGPDTLLCPGDQLQFAFTEVSWDYLWQDGNTSPNYIINDAGAFNLSITNACGTASDELNVQKLTALLPQQGFDTFYCPGDRIFIDVSDVNATYYRWQDSWDLPKRDIKVPGVYSVEYGNHCESVRLTYTIRDCENCEIYIPNVFSPNDDGINDRFLLYSDCPFEQFELKLFDRWGALVYEENSNVGWDGSTNSRNLMPGIYAWMAMLTVVENNRPRNLSLSGSVLLLR
ncbi:MAG: hypothetical protein DHS20C18_50910 [Saprospiraceae bacterium]|nr:MAG: hypothetical protein DHS20C18_50910 [Saprospiraceae bacterium]